MPNWSLLEQADRFVEIHTWMPQDEAFRLSLIKHEDNVPFCWECADWHFVSEMHSSA